MHEIKQNYIIEKCKSDKHWKTKARKHQSDFREQEMQVPAVLNTKDKCYGNVISEKDAVKGINFYVSFRDEIICKLKGSKIGTVLKNLLRSEHIPYNIFFPMRNDLKKSALLFRILTGRAVEIVTDIKIEYAPSPKEEYLNDSTSFDVYVEYIDSNEKKCGIGIEVKYTEQKSYIEKDSEELKKIKNADSTYYRVTRDSGCFDYGELSEKDFIQDNFGNYGRGNDLRQIWRNHILGLSMMQHCDGIKDFLSVHLYPSFNEHFNPKTSNVLKNYTSLLNNKGRDSFMPLTYEALFDAMKKCGMDEIDEGWIPYLTRRYIL